MTQHRSLLGVLVAAGVPLVAAIATASPDGYWLDGHEFVAAGAGLGVSHPPGQPLAVFLAYVCSLVPFGSLAFRVALASAVAGALASAFLYRAIEGTLWAMGLALSELRTPFAVAGTLVVVGAAGFHFQAVRPEVYALQAMLVFLALDALVTFYLQRPAQDWRPLYVASAALGLALTNHHFLALLVFPALAPAWALAYREAGARPLWLGGGLIAAALPVYLYLPARASASAALNLGDPDSFSRFWWVVSARVYQKNQGTGVPEPMVDRFLDVVVQLSQEFHWAVLLAALLGAYVLLRLPRTRGIGIMWITVFTLFCVARGWLGFVRSNPDAVGYLLPAFGAVGAFAAAFVGAASIALLRIRSATFLHRSLRLLWVLPVLAAFNLWNGAQASNLATFSDSDAFTELERRTLPNRSVVLVHDPQTVFRLVGAQAATGFRPDVTVVPMPFIAYPGVPNQLAKTEPALIPVLRHALFSGMLSVPAIQDVAKRRPLFLELDARIPPTTFGTLVPGYAYHQVLDSDAYEEDRRPGRLRQDKGWQLLGRLLPDVQHGETQRRLLWRSYHEALYFADAGNIEAALAAGERGLELFPETRELLLLREALRATEEGEPVDVSPFLIGAEPLQ